jgi:BirA family biotin operon repressor/biotin-[acetyl-CoA-carboxylase] ligase
VAVSGAGVTAEDLTAEALAAALPGRPVRAYPAMLSTEADALAWARAGGPDGGIVVAGYQAAPRGRNGVPWVVPPGGLAFSLLLRPGLPPQREGWLYPVALAALRDALGGGTLEWPDTVRASAGEGGVAAQVSVQGGLEAGRVAWAVVTVLVTDAPPPRGLLLGRIADAVRQRAGEPAAAVLQSVRNRCEPLGRQVRARLVPVGPSGIVVAGTAVDVDESGALVVETDAGRRQPVRPQDVGMLDTADTP